MSSRDLEALAQAASDQPEDGGLLFLVGAFLRDKGHTARAQKFFQQAAEVSPELRKLAETFAESDPPVLQEPQMLVGQEHEI